MLRYYVSVAFDDLLITDIHAKIKNFDNVQACIDTINEQLLGPSNEINIHTFYRRFEILLPESSKPITTFTHMKDDEVNRWVGKTFKDICLDIVNREKEKTKKENTEMKKILRLANKAKNAQNKQTERKRKEDGQGNEELPTKTRKKSNISTLASQSLFSTETQPVLENENPDISIFTPIPFESFFALESDEPNNAQEICAVGETENVLEIFTPPAYEPLSEETANQEFEIMNPPPFQFFMQQTSSPKSENLEDESKNERERQFFSS